MAAIATLAVTCEPNSPRFSGRLSLASALTATLPSVEVMVPPRAAPARTTEVTTLAAPPMDTSVSASSSVLTVSDRSVDEATLTSPVALTRACGPTSTVAAAVWLTMESASAPPTPDSRLSVTEPSLSCPSSSLPGAATFCSTESVAVALADSVAVPPVATTSEAPATMRRAATSCVAWVIPRPLFFASDFTSDSADAAMATDAPVSRLAVISTVARAPPRTPSSASTTSRERPDLTRSSSRCSVTEAPASTSRAALCSASAFTTSAPDAVISVSETEIDATLPLAAPPGCLGSSLAVAISETSPPSSVAPAIEIEAVAVGMAAPVGEPPPAGTVWSEPTASRSSLPARKPPSAEASRRAPARTVSDGARRVRSPESPFETPSAPSLRVEIVTPAATVMDLEAVAVNAPPCVFRVWSSVRCSGSTKIVPARPAAADTSIRPASVTAESPLNETWPPSPGPAPRAMSRAPACRWASRVPRTSMVPPALPRRAEPETLTVAVEASVTSRPAVSRTRPPPPSELRARTLPATRTSPTANSSTTPLRTRTPPARRTPEAFMTGRKSPVLPSKAESGMPARMRPCGATRTVPADSVTEPRALMVPSTSMRPFGSSGTWFERIFCVCAADGAPLTNMPSTNSRVGVEAESEPTLTVPPAPTITPFGFSRKTLPPMRPSFTELRKPLISVRDEPVTALTRLRAPSGTWRLTVRPASTPKRSKELKPVTPDTVVVRTSVVAPDEVSEVEVRPSVTIDCARAGATPRSPATAPTASAVPDRKSPARRAAAADSCAPKGWVIDGMRGFCLWLTVRYQGPRAPVVIQIHDGAQVSAGGGGRAALRRPAHPSRARASSACARPRSEIGRATSRPAASLNVSRPPSLRDLSFVSIACVVSTSATQAPGRQRRQASSTGCWSFSSRPTRTDDGNATFGGSRATKRIGWPGSGRPMAICAKACAWPWS